MTLMQKLEVANSSWLRSRWETQTIAENLNEFIECILDFVDNEWHPTEQDVDFLVTKFCSSTPETIAAVRLLGGLGDRFEALRVVSSNNVAKLLNHDSPSVRLSAAEALWQIGEKSSLHDVERAATKESEPVVRATLAHVVRILSSR